VNAANQLVIYQYYIGKWTNWRNYYFGLLTRIKTGWCFWLVYWNNDLILWKLEFCFHLIRIFLDFQLFFTCRAGKYCSFWYWLLFNNCKFVGMVNGIWLWNIQQLYLLLFFKVIVKRCGIGFVNGVLYSHGGYLQNQL